MMLALERTRQPFSRIHRTYIIPLISRTPCHLRPLNSCKRYHRSVLPLVHSAINLALPPGPFDDPTVTHRASCTTGSVPHKEEEPLLPMFLRSTSLSDPIGFLRPDVVRQILENAQASGERSIWNVLRRPDHSPWAVCFATHVAGIETRTHALRAVLERWRSEDIFPEILKGTDVCVHVRDGSQLNLPGWSGETYPIYTPRPERTGSGSSLAFGIERAALPLFGFANFGCFLTAFYDCSVTGKTLIWISRRSQFKNTWPGSYDCTVGGGMGVGETPHQAIVRECVEEASLPSDFVKKRARPAGMLNYMNRSPSKWILPGIYYLYELRLPNDGGIMPRTNIRDGEVDAFQLMDVEAIMERLFQGRFKPSSAMALVDFCIRHGFISPESDAGYLEICMSMRRPTLLPLP